MHVPGHDGDSLGVDGAEVGVFEQTFQIRFGSLLKSADGSGLELQAKGALQMSNLVDFWNLLSLVLVHPVEGLVGAELQ